MQHTLKNPKMHHYVDNNISSYQFKSVAIKTLFTLEWIVENISRLRYCYMNCSVKEDFTRLWFDSILNLKFSRVYCTLKIPFKCRFSTQRRWIQFKTFFVFNIKRIVEIVPSLVFSKSAFHAYQRFTVSELYLGLWKRFLKDR